MKTNDLKKGTRVRLSNGWYAILVDNLKGNTRDAKVFGNVTEIGSVYSHDIVSAQVDGKDVTVEHTPAQLKLKKMVQSFGM
jgi:hypothetical protein